MLGIRTERDRERDAITIAPGLRGPSVGTGDGMSGMRKRELLTIALKERRETGIFSGPPWTSKCLQPAFVSR